MNNFSVLDSRNRRNLLAHSINAFSPPFHANYSTSATATDMKTSFGDSLFINTLHLIPEPVKMNLADSVVTLDEKKIKTNMAAETKVNNGFNTNKPQNTKSDYYPSLAGITNFFSGVFNVMGAMFQKRANSPVQYYDCFEQGYEEHHQMTPSSLAWRGAKREDQNINGRAQTDDFANETYTDFSTDMSEEFKSIAAHCEEKINRVRLLLSGPAAQKSVRTRRPKRAFHEAGSVEELFEDAFTPEDFISLANETFLDYCSSYNNHHEELQTVDSPKIKTETKAVQESMEIIQNLPSECGESKSDTPKEQVEDTVHTKREVVSSCEDKVSQIKALLQCRRMQKSNLNNSELSVTIDSVNPPESNPIPIPNQPGPQSCADAVFAKEIELPVTPESPCVLAPNSYFDEVTGRFYSSSATDSEDSFQIVFSDSPRDRRRRIPSDCESEDSFIVFEETPDSCYTTNDVFGDEINDATNVSDSENSDSDCESELDSGVSTMALSHSLTRTFGDLTDGSLYEDSKSEDVVDCAFRSGAEIPKELIDAERVASAVLDHRGDGKMGLLLDEARKREKKKLPEKKVRFSEQPPKVHVMRVWAFAARQARAGPWERHALDRERFKRRIADVEMAISWVLKPQHRSRVMFQRFMPWWNAQKRKELAEKKQREEEERLKREKEEAERRASEEARLKGNNVTDSNEIDNLQIVSNLEDKEIIVSDKRTEHVNNGINNVNCKADIDSRDVVKLDSTRVDIKQAFDHSLGIKTKELVDGIGLREDEHVSKEGRVETMSNGDVHVNRLDNKDTLLGIGGEIRGVVKDKIETIEQVVTSETGIETVCNGDVKLNFRVDDSDESRVPGGDQVVKVNGVNTSQDVKSTVCDKRDFVNSDLKVNGDTLANNVLKNGIDKNGYIVCLQHRPTS